ncbi:hypothetical protein [Kitasatospora albolonga]|uniref:hypothetical protein n=1 Tax=Kitasatospora albolonga TaxID=68173 RepID=UPI001FC961DD
MKRYLQFMGAFVAVGVVLSVFLIVSGNSGGWALLVMIASMCAVAYFFVQRGKTGQP